MLSWLTAYKKKQCSVEPTWSNFLDALGHISLSSLVKRIEDCLKKAPSVVQVKVKEGECIVYFLMHQCYIDNMIAHCSYGN